MAQYTIEDIEIIRQKSGISYEEAVNLLEYHSGSLARALVDLEKNGRLKDAKNGSGTAHKRNGNILSFLYRFRLKVTKDDVSIVNLSALFMIFVCLVGVWIPLVGLIISLFLGYRITVERNSSDFIADSIEAIVKKASTNVRSTVNSVAREIERAAESCKTTDETSPLSDEPRSESAATGTTPVNVQFPDEGSVHVKMDMDGFHEADIQ